MRRPVAVLTLLTLGASACSTRDGGRARGDSATVAAPTAAAPAGAAAAPTNGSAAFAGCPHDGRWRACSVAERLDQAGLVPRPDTAPALRVPFLTGRDTVLRLGLGSLHAFVYDDTTRLAREVAALDTVRVAPRGGTFAWGEAPPTFVRSANLVAVVLVANERQLERVQLALQAGPPQRNPDRP